MRRTVMVLMPLMLVGMSVKADVCMTRSERDADMVRHLQTQMMVGALQCRGIRDLGQRGLYNEFVTGWKSELGRHGAVLISWFERHEGATWKSHLDRHVTELANRISAESRADPAFCAAIARLGEELRDADGDDLVASAARAPIAYSEPAPLCPGGERRLVTAQ
ncbi:MAG: hypothetical protein Kow00104_07000 [Rhodothalassiaceae bacterium]